MARRAERLAERNEEAEEMHVLITRPVVCNKISESRTRGEKQDIRVLIHLVASISVRTSPSKIVNLLFKS